MTSIFQSTCVRPHYCLTSQNSVFCLKSNLNLLIPKASLSLIFVSQSTIFDTLNQCYLCFIIFCYIF